jgi:Cu(I)/Ag(I) efflux system membrane protein CusA/SilA
MSRIAAPMVGGMISSTVLTLGVIPALYALVKQWQLQRSSSAEAAPPVLRPPVPAGVPLEPSSTA